MKINLNSKVIIQITVINIFSMALLFFPVSPIKACGSPGGNYIPCSYDRQCYNHDIAGWDQFKWANCDGLPYPYQSSCQTSDCMGCTGCSGGPVLPRCGDGSCNGSDTCTSCPQDCGVCPITNCPTCPKNPLPKGGTVSCTTDAHGANNCTYTIPYPYQGQYGARDDVKGADKHRIHAVDSIATGVDLKSIDGTPPNNLSLTFDENDFAAACHAHPGGIFQLAFVYNLHYPSACNVVTRYPTSTSGQNSSCEIYYSNPSYPDDPSGGCGNGDCQNATCENWQALGYASKAGCCYENCMIGPSGGCCRWPTVYYAENRDWSLGDWGPATGTIPARQCPPYTHKECQAGVCVDAPGGTGANQCTNNSTCQHQECIGPNVCTIFYDSEPNLPDLCASNLGCPTNDCFASLTQKEDTVFDMSGGSVCKLNGYTFSSDSLGQPVIGKSSSGQTAVYSGHAYEDENPPQCDISIYPHPTSVMQFIVDWGDLSHSQDPDSGIRWYEAEKCVKRRNLEDPAYFEDEGICDSTCVVCSAPDQTNCCEPDNDSDSDYWQPIYEACAPLNSDPNSIITNHPKTTIAVTEIDVKKSYYVRMRILDKAGNWSQPYLSTSIVPQGNKCGKTDEHGVCEGTGNYSPWCGDQLYFSTSWFQSINGHVHSNSSSTLVNSVPSLSTMVGDSTDTNYTHEASDIRGGFVSSIGDISVGSGTNSERGENGGWILKNYGKIYPPNGDQFSYEWFIENFGDNATTVNYPAVLLYELLNHDCTSNNYCRYKYEGDLTLGNLPQHIWNRVQSRQAVIFVNGNLIIDQDFVPPASYPSDCGENGDACKDLFSPSLAFIVKGDIKVDKNIKNMYGLFVANGNFNDGWNTINNTEETDEKQLRNKLNIFGSLIAATQPGTHLYLKRQSVAHNLLDPSEQIILIPKYFFELSSAYTLGLFGYGWIE